MKKTCSIVLLSCLLGFNMQGQSSFIFIGGSFHPKKIPEPKPTYFYQPALEQIREVNHHPGFGIQMGFGKKFSFNDRWSLLGAGQLQYQEYISDGNLHFFEKNEPKTLISEGVFKTHLQHAFLRTLLLVEKKIPLSAHQWSIFGGAYVNFKVEDWTKSHDEGTLYFEVEVDQFFDPACQCIKEVIISKTPLDPPFFYEGKQEFDSKEIRPVNFGLTGGISFPLLASNEGVLRGQVLVSQDLKPYFDDWRPHFYQTSITAGLMFEPEKIKRPPSRNPQKRTLSSGIYTGVSLHLNFASVDGMWLSSKKLGVEAAARYGLIRGHGRLPVGELYGGGVYRLGNSRFFTKMGGTYTWIQDSEYYDESRFSFVLGGKYVLPFSNFLGMQVNAGWRMSKGQNPFPELGIGLLLMPR